MPNKHRQIINKIGIFILIISMSDKNSILDSLVNEMRERFCLDTELVKYAQEELRSRWDSNEEGNFVSSLRDVDPNCYTRIQELKY